MDTTVDLHRLDDEVKAAKLDLAKRGYQKRGILFYGSSTMRNWREGDLIYKQMGDLPISNTGFGGSVAEELLYYYHELVVPVEPSVLVYYAGANDLNNGYDGEGVIAMTHRLFEWCRQDFKGIKFLIMPIKASAGFADREPCEKCNKLFAEYTQQHDDTYILDITPMVYDSEGKLRTDYYVEDLVHHNAEGYEALAEIVRPVVEKLYDGGISPNKKNHHNDTEALKSCFLDFF